MHLVNLTYSQNKDLDKLSVLAGHPRLFYTDQTLQDAKDWFVANPFEPDAHEEYGIYNSDWAVDAALFYLLTADGVRPENERRAAARKAIGWIEYALEDIEALDFGDGSYQTCNECRWYTEQIFLILDWCDAELTASERGRFYDSLSSLIPMWNKAEWGGLDHSPRSNFFQGYLRQSITFALLIYHENPTLAHDLLDEAINIRFKSFLEYAEGGGKGGVSAEGASYYGYIMSYPLTVSGISLANAGYNYFDLSDFYAKALVHNVYNTTPNQTFIGPNADSKFYLPFPFGDAGAYMNVNEWGEVINNSVTHPMLVASHFWQGRGKLPEYLRAWVDRIGAFEHNSPPAKYIESITRGLPQSDLSELPLDYFAPDGGLYTPYGYSRTSWDNTNNDVTAISVQLGKPPLGGHEHLDAGTFTIVRGDRLLVVPPSGRGFGSGWRIPDYEGEPSASVDVQNTISKNTILFGKEGSTPVGHTIEKIERLMSHPDFFYAANDITPAYKNPDNPTYSNNVHVENFTRETLFIKPLETFIVFDRTKSVEGQSPLKTSLIHVQGEPTQIHERKFSTVNGEQEAVIDILLPITLDIKVVDETEVTDCDWCQPRQIDVPHRLQMENSQDGEVYFLSVIQAKGRDEDNLNIVSVVEVENTFVLRLSHPTKGHAIVEFEKGMKSTKGRFGFNSSELPSELIGLPEEAQIIEVTDDGPVWYEVGTGPPTDSPEIVTSLENNRFESIKFSLYESSLNLNMGNSSQQKGQLRIYSSTGSLFFESNFNTMQGQSNISIPELKTGGMYLFRVELPDRVETFKVAIN